MTAAVASRSPSAPPTSAESASLRKGLPKPKSRERSQQMPLDFTVSREQEEIQPLAHEFAEKEIRPVAAHYDETEDFPWPGLKKAHQGGLTPAAVMPEAYGGGGLDLLSTLLIAQQWHGGCAGLALAIPAPGLA